MSQQHCILFYKYHPLTSSTETLEQYRRAQEKLCKSLNLTGRILIGLSDEGEGINGTLAGGKEELSVYVNCMLGRDIGEGSHKCAAATFREESLSFFAQINKPYLTLNSEQDFKWSSRSTSSAADKEEQAWFPDLNVKLVKEIISTGGEFSKITANETSVGYLTPTQWHEEMKLLQQQNHDEKQDQIETVLVDVRNHKECQIGTFVNAIDPNTRTFSQFPKWVRDHAGVAGNKIDPPAAGSDSITSCTTKTSLDNKRILLYCTGGIRCEKASAYVRKMVPNNKGVFHLKGGIHKYLEEFGDKDSKFVGKNFVFDRRGAMSTADCLDGEKGNGNDRSKVVGKCLYCSEPYDIFLPENVCTVCREPVLVCPTCIQSLIAQQLKFRSLDLTEHNIRVELHCEDHFQVKSCYYTSLFGFSLQSLMEQIQQLQLYSKQFEGIGKKGKQKRRTLRKQIEKIESFIERMNQNEIDYENEVQCRNCNSTNCAGDCWGFHGGNRRMINKEQSKSVEESKQHDSFKQKQRNRTPSNHRPSKRIKREKELSEVKKLQLCQPPSVHRLESGMRVPPPCIRVLSSSVKGKWCGRSLASVMASEFHAFADSTEPNRLNEVINAGLLRIDGVPVTGDSSDILLRNMTTIERVTHWHEPPIYVPQNIPITKEILSIGNDSNDPNNTSSMLYCVNKPASCPVYPAGPYFANSLLMMVEAQEGITPKSLIPCHRIDRCTSGVLLCTDDTNVARMVHSVMTCAKPGTIKKLYVAKVAGRFPAGPTESIDSSIIHPPLDFAHHQWRQDVLEVSAPIAVQFPENKESSGTMRRIIASSGKHAISLFKLLCFDHKTNTSLVACSPLTGRGHQLRVHLQFIGHPIHNDVEYGGAIDSELVKKKEMQSVQAIIASRMATSLRDDSVSVEEAKAAISICKCCQDGEDGVKASFQSAQLLGQGHIIHLHAHKYSITFKQNSIATEGKSDIEFTAALPSWASDYEGLPIDWI